MNKLMLGSLLLVMGCSTIGYQVDSNTVKQPQMSLPEAFLNIEHGIQTMNYRIEDFQMTSKGFSFQEVEGVRRSARFDDVQVLTMDNSSPYEVVWDKGFNLLWVNQNDAEQFVDSVMAIKYYASKQYLADEAAAFADFQEKVKVWQALPQKPPLPEETRRFRVLADDAVQNKNFYDAANYYEQGLAIDPMWPAGQFNAAIIYGELKLYPMAVMHMKRYLVLKPDAQDAKADQDKIYIWEEKANE